VCHQCSKKENEKDEKKDLCNTRGRYGNTCKAKDSGKNSNDVMKKTAAH
jgi:hypothetical protein